MKTSSQFIVPAGAPGTAPSRWHVRWYASGLAFLAFSFAPLVWAQNPRTDAAEEILVAFSERPQIGTLGPVGKSSARIATSHNSAGAGEGENHKERLTVSCTLPRASGSSYGGAFVRIDTAGAPVSFASGDKLRIDLRNLGDDPVALAIECKVPGDDAAYLTANFTLKANQGWITAEIPMSRIPAGQSEAFDVVAFVVRATARFEVDHIRCVRR